MTHNKASWLRGPLGGGDRRPLFFGLGGRIVGVVQLDLDNACEE